MKKIITSIVIVTLVTMYLQACKKSDTTTATPQTTLQKLQGKWFIQTDMENDHYSGADHIRTSIGTASDYVEFRTDGNVYISAFGYIDTAPFALSGDTKIVITSTTSGTITFDIKTLTATSLVLYEKTLYSGTDFYEETITLKK